MKKINLYFYTVLVFCFMVLLSCGSEEGQPDISLGIPFFTDIENQEIVTDKLFVKWTRANNAEFYQIHSNRIENNEQEFDILSTSTKTRASRKAVFCGLFQEESVIETTQNEYLIENLELNYEYLVRALRTNNDELECSIFSFNSIKPRKYEVSLGGRLPFNLAETIDAMINTTSDIGSVTGDERVIELPVVFSDEQVFFRFKDAMGNDVSIDELKIFPVGSYTVQVCNLMSVCSATSTFAIEVGRIIQIHKDSKLYSDIRVPNVPMGLMASEIGATNFILSWDIVDSAVRYEVTGDGNIEITNNEAAISELEFGEEYNYRVRACNGVGCSGYSVALSVTPTVEKPGAPVLSFSDLGVSSVVLSWDATGMIDNYQVSGDGVITIIEKTAEISGLAVGTTYDYKVQACNMAGCSAYSNIIFLQTLLPTATPDAPTNLMIESSTDRSISLSWSADLQAENYIVYYYRSGREVVTTDTVGLRIIDEDLSSDTEYRYKLQSCSRLGCSLIEETDFVVARTKLSAPLRLESGEITSISVRLNWDRVRGATNYEVYRDEEFENNVNDNVYIGTVVSGTNYDYKVRSCNTFGCSIFSSSVSVLTLPATPMDLSTSDVRISSLVLSWSPVLRADRYELTGDGSREMLGETRVRVGGLKEQTGYNYGVRACNDSGCSRYSSLIRVTTLLAAEAPGQPLNFRVESSTDRSITLSWEASLDVGEYILGRYDASDNMLLNIVIQGASVTTDVELGADTEYRYRLQACNSKGCSVSTDSILERTKLLSPTVRVVEVRRSSAVLDWQAVPGAVSYEVSGDEGTKSIVMNMRVAVMITDLEPSTDYAFQVRACNGYGCSTYSMVETLRTRSTEDIESVSVILRLSATRIEEKAIDLSWDTVGANVYKLYRNGQLLSELDGGISSTTDAMLAAGTSYDYQLEGCASDCFVSSDILRLVTIPAKPSNLETSGDIGVSSFTLRWDATGVITYYELEGSGDEKINIEGMSAEVSNLRRDTSYDYRVQSCNISGCSKPSDGVSVRTLNPTRVPEVPTNFRIESSTDMSIGLEWGTNMQAESYRLHRYDSTEIFLASTDVMGLSTTDTGVGCLILAYKYKLQACNIIGCSLEESVDYLEVRTKLRSPISFVVIDISTDNLTLSWDVVMGAKSYEVIGYRGVEATGNTIRLSGLLEGVSYSYRVRACNSYGCSALSLPVDATTIPPIPVELNVISIMTNSVTLGWEDATGATYYNVTGGSVSMEMVAGTMVEIVGLDEGVSYGYRVQACNESGCSGYSIPISVTTLITPPGIPISFRVESSTDTSIELRWGYATGDPDYYRLGRYNEMGIYSSSMRIIRNTSTVDSGLSPNTEYQYRLQSCKSNVCSASTDILRARTRLEIPTNLQKDISADGIDISWGEVSGADDYEVSGDGSKDIVGNMVMISGLDANTVYVYQVRACNGYGCSYFSVPIRIRSLPSKPILEASNITMSSVDLSWDAEEFGKLYGDRIG